MKLKKSIITTFAAAMLTFSAASYAKTNLTVWCWDDNFNVPAAKLAAQNFTKTHPDVTIDVQSIANDSTIQKLNAALGAKNAKALPDIVLIEDYRVQNFLNGYPNFLKDLSNVVDYNNFVDYKVAASSLNGKHYGVPFDSGASALFVRIDMFNKAGYKLEDLQNLTWDQFIEIGKKVKAANNGVDIMPYDPNDLMELRIMLQSAGQWYSNADGSVNIKDNQALKEGLMVFKKLNDNKLLHPYSGWNQFLASFQNSQVAAVVSSCWLAPSFEVDKKLAGKWRIIPIPKFANIKGATQYSNQGGSQWYVNNYSKNADVAAQFLAQTFGSDRQLINELAKKIGLISTMKNISDLPNYNVKNPYFGNQEVSKMFVQWNEKIIPLSYGQDTKAIESFVQEALQRVLNGDDINNVLSETQEIAAMQIGK